ncbi:uncharacterized protein LOC132630840 [Lycium barbarum]|uniref:uncharacterized protein LOC132630840 n=1 Tax=Lycium barbarum TaxID=112863 RepID=UPI00293EE672|nr:uncharacterized protein LOC132630840 [Lycium barbarum]
MVTEDENLTLVALPNIEEVKSTVFAMNDDRFAEDFVDMIWRLIANNWYSVMFNGQPYGFFHSTKGVKQGDRLSSSVFILAAEILSRALNNLFEDPMIRGYGLPKWSADLNNLSIMEEKRNGHWTSWQNMCFPKEEGGMGLRSLFDISKALFAKLLWRFRTSCTLWSTVMSNKYCKKHIPTLVKCKEGSQLWKRMLEARDEMEQHTWWETKNGSSSLWFDNWTRLGPLIKLLQVGYQVNEDLEDVYAVLSEGKWDIDLLHTIVPEEIIDHIRSKLILQEGERQCDKPWWMLTSAGKFTVSSAWEIIRQKKQQCCMVPQQETMIHLFLTGEFAAEIWQVFVAAVGVNGPFVQINQAVTKWWTTKCNSKLRPFYQAAPSIIMWHLWKRRNTKKYYCLTLLENWPQLVQVLEVHQPYITCTTVQWLVPPTGNLMFTWESKTAEASSLEAEAKAILEGVIYCANNQFVPLIIERDSLLMRKVLEGEWKVCMDINKIQEWRQKGQTQMAHMFREGNKLGDYLANMVVHFEGFLQYHSYQDLPAEAKTIVLSDKMQKPRFRFKTWKTKEPD